MRANSLPVSALAFRHCIYDLNASTHCLLLLLIDGSGERRPEPRHGRVSRGVTPDDFGTLETWCATPTKAT